MQHLFGAHIVKLRFNKCRRHRGRQPAGPAEGGATLVLLARCSMNWNGQLWRPRGISPLCFSSTRFIVGLCLIIKTSTLPRLREQDPPDHHTTHSIAGPKLIVMPWNILFSPRAIPHWKSLALTMVAAKTTEEFRALILITQPEVFLFQNFKIHSPLIMIRFWSTEYT